jgi:hypothetical protein
MFDENGTLVIPPGVELWCHRRIPAAEIVARISERSDTDCEFAFNVFKDSPIGSILLKLLIDSIPKYATAAEMIEHDQARIQGVTAHFEKRFGSTKVTDFFHEAHALAIEYLFREKRKFLANNP